MLKKLRKLYKSATYGGIKRTKASAYTLCYWTLIFTPLISCQQAPTQVTYHRTQILMGNVPVSIDIETAPQAKQQALNDMNESFALAQQMATHLSSYLQDNELAQLNHAATQGQQWKASKIIYQLIQHSLELHRWTNGYFDPAYTTKNPSTKFESIILSPETKTLDFKQTKGLQLNFGGIAKGAIVDAMAERLKQRGYKHFLINAGGDLWANGPWTINLQQASTKMPCFLELNNQAIASSGLTERGTHLFDPIKQRISKQNFYSTSVIANSAATADALATAFYIAVSQSSQVFSNLQNHLSSLQVVFTHNDGSHEWLGTAPTTFACLTKETS